MTKISIEQQADFWWDWGLSVYKKKQLREKYLGKGVKVLLPEQKLEVFQKEMGSTTTKINQTISPVIMEAVEALDSVRWISTDEKLPYEGQRVFYFTVFPWGKTEQVYGYYDTGKFQYLHVDFFDATYQGKVTHWMPLPEEPTSLDRSVEFAINKLKALSDEPNAFNNTKNIEE